VFFGRDVQYHATLTAGIRMSDARLVPVGYGRLRPGSLGFECTEDVAPLTDFVGQNRAVRSLEFGLGMQRAGYNIFVTGLTGTGRTAAILEYIRRQVEKRRESGNHVIHDWCYVHNFDDPDRPNAIAMTA
jgi:Cdc6-like AAA superfamily ATPase